MDKKNGSDIRIVVLQRGWVIVGRYSQDGQQCFVDGGHVVRRWGTKKGLGEIAEGGPTKDTVLDPIPWAQFHELTALFTLACEEEKWSFVCR